eukprot:947203_1
MASLFTALLSLIIWTYPCISRANRTYPCLYEHGMAIDRNEPQSEMKWNEEHDTIPNNTTERMYSRGMDDNKEYGSDSRSEGTSDDDQILIKVDELILPISSRMHINTAEFIMVKAAFEWIAENNDLLLAQHIDKVMIITDSQNCLSIIN